MIRGIGVDVVDIQRMKETLVEQGDAFRRRVFTEAEIDYCDRKPRPYENYAARFAATRELTPVPILGVPGWCEDNARERYYDNPDYFRPARRTGGEGPSTP